LPLAGLTTIEVRRAPPRYSIQCPVPIVSSFSS
jgi:hypothetical protein